MNIFLGSELSQSGFLDKFDYEHFFAGECCAIYFVPRVCCCSPLLEFKAPRPQYLPLILNVNRKL